MSWIALVALAVLGVGGAVFALAVIRADDALSWIAALPRRLRARGWGLLLVPVAVIGAAMTDPGQPLIAAEILLAGLLLAFAPRAARQAVPFALLSLGVYQAVLAYGNQDKVAQLARYAGVSVAMMITGANTSRARLVLPEAVFLLLVGLWLLVKVQAPGARPAGALTGRWLGAGRRGGPPAAPGLLLLPVAALALELLGPRDWFGAQWLTVPAAVVADTLAVAACLVLVFRSRIWAATLAEVGLLVLGGYGIAIATFWPAVPGFWYVVLPVDNLETPVGCGLEGAVLLALGLWLAPRVVREHRAPAELAARTQQLTERVQTLTRTRSDAVDTAAAELRRIERDLHDGAQARLVAVGMSLRAAERLFATSPQAALALVAEAKESSSRALTELRDLVRGIYPPVLADRGLADAIRALALDAPLPTELDIDLPGHVDLPVASAVYFSVAEALANATKHGAARRVRIVLRHAGGLLRAEVTDDGAGGADPACGTGLAGVERRLAAFDGILAVSSPPGGPTIVVIEVPCALSSPKTSTC